jgi:hypothetical protein
LLAVQAPTPAWAGAQAEEPLADAGRSALSASVADRAPPRPSFANIDQRLAYLRWLGEMSERLKRRHGIVLLERMQRVHDCLGVGEEV